MKPVLLQVSAATPPLHHFTIRLQQQISLEDKVITEQVMRYTPDLHCVLKVENNCNKPFNIRGIFSSAGEIPQLYPYDTGVPGQFHYFVEYRHRGSVDQARQLKLGSSAGLIVYPIHSDQRLIKQFRSCKAYGPSPHLATQVEAAIWPSPADLPALPTHPSGGRGNFPARSSGFASSTPDCESSARDPRDSTKRLTTNASKEASASNTAHISTTSDGSGNIDTADIFTPLTLDSRLLITIQGQEIIYDLAKSAEQDPKIVIELLRLSLSERGNWMIAGAHFRRIGQPRAAIDIMYAMLEVMVKNGFVEAKLKPVFLLLSGCELDMAISARNAGDLTASEQHYANVQMWLQKVYGTTAPAPGSIPSVGPSSPVQSKQTQPSQPRETDYGSPRGTVIERISGSKRKLEEAMPMERNVRRRNTGPTRAMKRFKEKRRYSSNNKENRRFNRT